MKQYQKTVKDDGSHYFLSQCKCPFLRFKKCRGDECSLFSITGFIDEKGIKNDFGECALVKIPTFLIDIKNILTVEKSKKAKD